MKTKSQKESELKKGEELLAQSNAVLLFDFTKVGTADMRNLRKELKQNGNPLLIIKKRLLNLLLKKRGGEVPPGLKAPVGTVFVSNIETAAASVYKFFAALEKEKKIDGIKMLGGYDLTQNAILPQEQVIAIGKLPPREVLLAQLLGMLAAPIRSFLYILQQKGDSETKSQ